ncbi:MAG: hypothetical protein H7A19_18585 [Rhodanobacteraceae bacterium]|nr:hypothetical protein [Rhodanobacteraceae bacterium]
MSARLVLLALLTATLMALPASGRADYKTDYQDGIEAAEKGDWAEVQRRMRAALAENAKPSNRMRTYGTNFIPYVPHYYLGLANARLGDCTAAIDAFSNPASRGVVSGLSKESDTQAREEARCTQMLAQARSKPEPPPTTPMEGKPPVVVVSKDPVVTGKPTPTTPTGPAALSAAQIAPIQTLLSRIDQKIDGISGQLRSQPLAGSGDARALGRDLESLKQGRQQLGSNLERARSGGDSQRLGSLSSEAQALERNVATLDDRVSSARSGLAQAAEARALEQARQRASSAIARLDQDLSAANSAGIAGSAQAKAASEARGRLQQASAGSDRKAIESALNALTRASGDLQQAIAAAPKPAPEQLRTLVSWYLSAQYSKAADWDQLERLPDARARANALLVRAASRWHLYVRGGEVDGKLSAAVDIDLREARRLDEALKPNPQAFSPRLIERFASL